MIWTVHYVLWEAFYHQDMLQPAVSLYFCALSGMIAHAGLQLRLALWSLADLMHVLWEADVSVFKAHITTGPSNKVLDLFWIYDNKKELPENHRSVSAADVLCQHNCLHVWPQELYQNSVQTVF